MKKKQPFLQLLDSSIITETRITCDKCMYDNSDYGDEYACVEGFYKLGWRSRTLTYCPKCAKKYLKKKD